MGNETEKSKKNSMKIKKIRKKAKIIIRKSYMMIIKKKYQKILSKLILLKKLNQFSEIIMVLSNDY